jgi:hypothetical protein
VTRGKEKPSTNREAGSRGDGQPFTLDTQAHALRPFRIVNGGMRLFEGRTFPNDPFAGCALILRRLSALGMLKDDGHDCWLDIWNAKGDIIHDTPITRDGFEYLRGKLRLLREA